MANDHLILPGDQEVNPGTPADVDPLLHVDSGPILFAKPRTMHIDNSMLPTILARQPVVIEFDENQGVISEIGNAVLRRNAPGRRARAELVRTVYPNVPNGHGSIANCLIL